MAAMKRVETAQDFQDVLNEGSVRITFGFAFGINGSMKTASLEVGHISDRGRTLWTRITPMLVERDGGGRADLLQQMIDILGMEKGDE